MHSLQEGKMAQNADYNKYYNSKIILRRENTKRVVEKVMPIIEKIINEANSKDPRFSAQPKRIGSYYQGLKIKRADEFDLNIPLVGMENYSWSASTPAKYGFNRVIDDQLETYPQDIKVVSKAVPLPDPPPGYSRIGSSTASLWKRPDLETLDFHHLIPFLVRRHYRNLVHSAIRKFGLMGTVILSRKKHGPAVTLNIQVPSLQHAVSIDLSPVADLQAPIHSSCGFPHAGTRWPSQETIKAMQKMGTSFTAQHDFEWR